MKMKCKSCGKSFELSDGEIKFFKSKNMHLPKRCKACRKSKAKQNDDTSLSYANSLKIENNTLNQNPIHNSTISRHAENNIKNYKNAKTSIIYLLIALIFFVATLVFNQSTDKQDQQASKKTQQSFSAQVNESSQAQQISTHKLQIDSSKLKFRTAKQLNSHYHKHGKKMGYSSAEKYLERANMIIHADVITKTQDDGDTAYFLQTTGEFVVVSPRGYIRTFFIPNDGIDYFNRQ